MIKWIMSLFGFGKIKEVSSLVSKFTSEFEEVRQKQDLEAEKHMEAMSVAELKMTQAIAERDAAANFITKFEAMSNPTPTVRVERKDVVGADEEVE